MDEIEGTVLIKIPGYEESYCYNMETNQVYGLKRKKYLKYGNCKGYYCCVLSKNKQRHLLYLHQLVFLVNHGYLPTIVDHIDNDITNNSIDNLRGVTYSQNAMNRKIGKNNTSGFKGITKNGNGWRSQIIFDGQMDDKTFKLKSEAIEYNRIMRESLHGEYKREN